MKKIYKQLGIVFVMAFAIMIGCLSNNVFAADQYTGNLIPKMTSNTVPEGRCFSNGYEDGSSYYEYLAFDKSDKDECSIWASATLGSGYLGYEFTSPTIINKYTITSRNNNYAFTQSPINWTFEGSNDGQKWTTLDNRTGISDWKVCEKKEFTFNNDIAYKMYRINISYIGAGSTDRPSIGELEMMQKLSSSTSITMDKTTDSLQVGKTDTLTATITPDNATNKNVAWKSSDESIATVDQTGKVTAVKEGTATITATTTDGSNLSASCVVTVTPQGTTPTNPTDNTGNAILNLTMTNGNIKSYTVSMSKVNDFISWYNNRSAGSNGSPYYAFDKTDNLQPFSKKTEYVVFDKISSFEVDEYTKQ
ncbi:Ig-like domain-containing protein [Clostridium sp. AWRP]|uniref:Ig-like domain-containing protein n=1 Tax=Clostridium sp. AWRP TaxID=2212991 RepID=UPI000FDAF6FE|nr:Ig-like domain-containing protein [Clostridium sp. AWRP]AZV56066.1 Ig domain-containing protein [Clostridium sp. AWRP]